MPATQGRTNLVGVNQFKFSGKIDSKKFQFSGAGKMWGSVKVTVPNAKDAKYNTFFFVKFLNADLAEKAEAELVENNNYLFYGNIKTGSYLHKTTGQKVYTTDFIVNGWADAVENNGIEPIAENTGYVSNNDNVPF